MGRRRTKQRRIEVLLSSSSSSSDEPDESSLDGQKGLQTMNDEQQQQQQFHPSSLPKKRRRRRGPRNRLGKNERDPSPEHEDCYVGDGDCIFLAGKEEEENVPFCCAVCTCSKEIKMKLPDGEAVVEESDENELYNEDLPKKEWIIPGDTPVGEFLAHRMCCHGLFQREEESDESFERRCSEWCPPYLKAVYEEAIEESTFEWVTKKEIKSSYITAKGQESCFYNNDYEARPIDILRTHPDYKKVVEVPFKNHLQMVKDGVIRKKRIKVLSLFAGIGTDQVVLKRLGIEIDTCIYVDHDKVSKHVFQYNHDPAYNSNLLKDLPTSSINHVYDYNTFEELEADADNIFKKYGPIDLVVGGPPCIDYAKVNANRKGTKGKQGQYMVRLGCLTQKIQQIQNPAKNPLYFLAENVIISGNDLTEINEAFGVDWNPIRFNAEYVSPTRRDRYFWTNIPVLDIEFDAETSHQSPDSCLEQGFHVPSHLVDKNMTAKANCIMASKSRMDERNTLRMYVFQPQEKDKKFYGRPLSILERERLMGYPDGYVEIPVNELFQILVNDGLARIGKKDKYGKNCEIKYWKEVLDKKYHHFAGDYHNLYYPDCHRFDPNHGYLALKLAPPKDSERKPDFFNEEYYAKHLLGLAFSVPVVENLLKPLQQLFCVSPYKKFTYSYKWDKKIKIEHT